MKIICETKSINKSFILRGSRFWNPKTLEVLNDVSLQVREQQTIGLVGESGSGKSTLAKIILGIEKQNSGQVLYDNQVMATRSKLFKRNVQIVFQDPLGSLNPRRKVKSILLDPFHIHKIKPNKGLEYELESLIDSVHLDKSYLTKYPHELSGGEAQRIAIARAIALKPKLLICDEAVSSLDVIVRAQILNLLLELQQSHKIAYLFISHDMDVVRHMSDQIITMNKGRTDRTDLGQITLS